MKAVIKETPAPGAALRDIPIPPLGDEDLLVRVKTAAICGTDLHILNWTPWAQKRVHPPMVFGHEFAGDVVDTGNAVKRFKTGDRVACETHVPCGSCIQCLTGNAHICENMKIVGVHVPGVFTEFAIIPQACAWSLSDSISYETGALLEPMGVAMHGFEAAGDVGGKDVLILGCGPIGLMGAAIARFLGARQVICTDHSPAKLGLARKMGATLTVESPRLRIDADPVIETVREATSGRGVEVVVDFSGSARAIEEGLVALQKGGTMVLMGLPSVPVTLDLSDGIIYKEATIKGVTGRNMYKTWFLCEKALCAGKIDLTPLIGGRYPLSGFDSAFAAIAAKTPGKMLLFPETPFEKEIPS